MQINEIKNLCNKFGIHPSKNLGQNFLLDENVVKKMAEAAELKNSDTVLEIGPGFGVLTGELVGRADKVIAVEMDKRLAEYLATSSKRQETKDKLQIINDDILKLGIKDYGIGNKYKIVSNLPYQITSPILWKFLHEDPLEINNHPQAPSLKRRGDVRPELMVLMVQKEVGERICAKPGKMSVLAVMCQLYAECEFLFEVDRENFWPAPDVDSAVVKLSTRIDMRMFANKYANNKTTTTSPQPSPRQFGGQACKGEGDGGFDERNFIRLVKFGFSAKRKMLKNNLSGGLQKPMNEVVVALKVVGLNEKVRAQELSVEDWVKLYREINGN